MDMMAQRLRDLGILVLKCDNRGSARRGLAFEASLKGVRQRQRVLSSSPPPTHPPTHPPTSPKTGLRLHRSERPRRRRPAPHSKRPHLSRAGGHLRLVLWWLYGLYVPLQGRSTTHPSTHPPTHPPTSLSRAGGHLRLVLWGLYGLYVPLQGRVNHPPTYPPTHPPNHVSCVQTE